MAYIDRDENNFVDALAKEALNNDFGLQILSSAAIFLVCLGKRSFLIFVFVIYSLFIQLFLGKKTK